MAAFNIDCRALFARASWCTWVKRSLCEVARFLLGNNQFVRHVGHITQVLHELAEMLDGMLQRIEGRRPILSSDAVRDRHRHFRAREELPFAAVQHAYRAEAVDIFRAYHF